MSETQGSQVSERIGAEIGNGRATEFAPNSVVNKIETATDMMHGAIQNHQDIQDASRRLQKSPSSEDHRRQPGECRLLPVLVDLRSSLESAPSQSRPSSIDFASQKLDLSYFQDLCTTDLKTALLRLEETLKRVDINSLSKYTSTLGPSDRLHLLQLISTLVTNLKRAKMENDENQDNRTPPQASTLSPRRPRRRSNRHTIGVSTEELASARRWLEQERGSSGIVIPQKTESKFEPPNEPPPAPESIKDNHNIDNNQRTSDCPWGTSNDTKTCDKHIKDAINQKQSLQHKIKEDSVNHGILSPDESINTWTEPPERPLTPQNERPIEKFNFTHQNQIFNRSNKFTAKKTKLKRANTIDIPNYLKLQAEKQKLNGTSHPGLRRPIDISDKSLSQFSTQLINSSPSIPEFQPKTDNDRKFLALINKNTEKPSEPWKNPTPTSPFKSFNYRQMNSTADKNWKSRFSNIKTTFDRQSSISASTSPASSVNSAINPAYRRQSNDHNGHFKAISDAPRIDGKNSERNSKIEDFRRFSSYVDHHQHSHQPRAQIHQCAAPNNAVFTHAAGSPFKKVESPKLNDFRLKKLEQIPTSPSEKTVPSSYLPACATGGLLKAKLRMFDHQNQSPPEVPKKSQNYHQKPSNPQVFSEKSKNPKYQHLHLNNIDYHQHPFKPVESPRNSKLEKEIQVDVHDKIEIPIDEEQNYQSVGVQTSARPSPMPPMPVDDDQPVNFYKPPEAHSFYAESENPIYVPPKLREMMLSSRVDDCAGKRLDSSATGQLDDLPPVTDAHTIENQDIMEDKVITRYTAAIGTMAPSKSSRIPDEPNQRSLMVGKPIILQDEMQDEMKRLKTGQPAVLLDDIQRHNLLQLSLIKRIQDDQQNQLFESEPIIEINNTQEKINIFEERSVPRINITKVMNSSVKPVDSSDEYLVSCSNRPNRSIVLSKSESWHQLAGGKGHLQVPQPSMKPPKSNSPMRMTKNYDSGSNQNLKKMEEKVQRYFGNSQSSDEKKAERKGKARSFSPRKMPNLLSRSQTMPHVFDDSCDVDKAFEHVFEETTKDHRY